MKYTLTQKKNDVTIAFEATAKEWAESVDRAYQSAKGKFNVPGFRKGKAPKAVIVRMYGESVFYDDAFNFLFGDCYDQVQAKEKGFRPVSRPDVKVDELTEKGVTFQATVTVMPEVVMGDYKAIKLKPANKKVTEKDVDAEVDRARERAARRVEVTDRAAQSKDVVNLDYSGYVGDEQFEGGTAEGQELKLGSGQFIAGFETQVEGMKTGEEKDIKVKFPDDYAAMDLAGKDATFHVKVNTIYALEVPEANDAFAQDIAGVDTFAAYRAELKNKMEVSVKEKNKRDDEDAILEAVAKLAKVDIPEVMIEQEINKNLQEIELRMKMQGLNFQDYLKYANTTVEEMRKARYDDCKKAVKLRLAIEKIISAEKIKVEQKDYDKRVEELAASAKMDAGQFAMKNQDRLEYVYNEMLMDKVLKKLGSWVDWGTGAAAKTTDGEAKKPAAAKKEAAEKPAATAPKTAPKKTTESK